MSDLRTPPFTPDSARSLPRRSRGPQPALGEPGSSMLVLVRHGETAGNRDGRYQTYDTPLSDLGRAQAARVAERLAAEGPVHALYSSDLTRTMETAAVIGARLGLRPIPERALRELDVGAWKGYAHAEIEGGYPGGLTAWIAAGGSE